MTKGNWIVAILLILGIGWAAWDDLSRKDPEWKKSECYKGIEYSVHQDKDDRWVLGIRNRYTLGIKPILITYSGNEKVKSIHSLHFRPAETMYLDLSRLESPEDTKVDITIAFMEDGSYAICDNKK